MSVESVWDRSDSESDLSSIIDGERVEQAVTAASLKFVASHHTDSTHGRRSSGASSVIEVAHISVLEPPSGLPPFLSSCIVVNYISAGYVLLPWAFAQGGTLLSCIILALTSLQSNITATFVLESSARAETLRHIEQSRHGRRDTLPRSYSMEIRQHTYELSELARIFLGKCGQRLFTATTAFDLYGIMWAFAAIFGTTLADNLPMTGRESDYQLYLLIFAVIVIPLACVPVIDQCWIQLCFLVARTVMVLFMIITVAVGYASSTPQFGTQVGPVQGVPLADFSNLMILIQVCVFSTAFQFAVPGISGVSRNKKVLLEIFGSAVSYIFVTNVILGLLLAIFFGSKQIAESSNLNWLDYHGGTWDGTGDIKGGRAGWASFISNFIVLFAAIDGLAVYPLIAVSLGDILLGAFYGQDAHNYRNDWKRRSAFRLLASIPQIVGAMFVQDLGVIATYAGIFTLLSYTTCPSMLAIASRKRMKKDELPVESFYHTPFASVSWAWALCILSILVIIGVIVDSVFRRYTR